MGEIKSHVGEQFEFENCGKFIVTKDLGKNKSGHIIVEIQFIDTGTIKTVEYYNAVYGKIKDPKKEINDIKNNIYQSSFGNYRIIDDLGTPPGKKVRMVTVQFIDTGYTYNTQFTHALNGNVKDPTRFLYNVKDTIFTSNHYGQFKIIYDYGKENKIRIKFLNTGSEVDVFKTHAMNGQVKDPAVKNINESNQLYGAVPIESDKIDIYLKPCWISMIRRCYNENDKAFDRYGQKGVTVSEDWKEYENFKFDAQNLPGWESKVLDPYNFHLDKDVLQINLPYENRVYSRNTCIWLPASLNSNLPNNPNMVKIYYGYIYDINNIYFIKNPNQNDYSYGPFFDFAQTVRMATDFYRIYDYGSTTIPLWE